MTPKEARKAKGLSLRDMARICACSAAYICQIEGGKQPASLRVSDAYEGACGLGPLDWPKLHRGAEQSRRIRALEEENKRLKAIIGHQIDRVLEESADAYRKAGRDLMADLARVNKSG